MSWKRVVYWLRQLLHKHGYDKEVELAGMDYWPFEHIRLRVCKCGSTKIEELVD